MSDNIKSVIEWQVEKISGLLGDCAHLPVDRLREETAELQVILAEAARLERIGADGELPAAAE